MELLRKNEKILCIFGLTAALLIGAVVWYSEIPAQTLRHPESIPNQVKAVILPHHLLVGPLIEEFYRQLSANNDYGRIFLISPNHFDYGFHYVQTTDTPDPTKIIGDLDLESIKDLAASRSLSIEPEFYPREHGITVHLPFIRKFFPKAKVIPIIIKRTTPEKILNALADELLKISDEKTLIIASIDFSHYEEEKYALKNDRHTINWLENLENNPPEHLLNDLKALALSAKENAGEEVGMDSPESLYVTAVLLNHLKAAHWSLWARTSSAMLMPGLKPKDNTSHIFGYFTKSGE